jgi:putative inorganic carbon (HCO3(-)) transporter
MGNLIAWDMIRSRGMQKLIKASVIPALALLCMLMGLLLLYSAEIALAVLAVILVPVSIFVEPFIGAMLYLICLYVRPFEILPIPPSIPVMKLLAAGTLAIWLLHVIIYRKRTFVKAPQNMLMIAFLAVLMASHKAYIHGILNAFSEFSKIVIIYFLLTNLVTNERRLKATIWVLILCTTYLAVQGVLLSMGIAIGGINFSQGVRVQSTGIFGDPNDLAMTLIIGLPFIFHFFFSERFALKRIILVAFGGLMLYCILLTGSRGGMIGLAVVAYLLLRKKTGAIVGAVLTFVCLVGFLAMAPSYTVERLRSASLSEGTGHSRIEHWYDGWNMFLSNPITGVGMNNYPDHAAGFVAHNSFIHVAAETGMVGLLIWMGLFYFAFKNLVAVERKVGKIEQTSFDWTMSNSLKASLIGFVVCGFFLSRQYQYIPYILIALSVSIHNMHNGQGDRREISIQDVISILGITFGFMVLWYIILKMFA